MQEISDYVTYGRLQTGVNKKLAAGILQIIITYETHPTYYDTTGPEKVL